MYGRKAVSRCLYLVFRQKKGKKSINTKLKLKIKPKEEKEFYSFSFSV